MTPDSSVTAHFLINIHPSAEHLYTTRERRLMAAAFESHLARKLEEHEWGEWLSVVYYDWRSGCVEVIATIAIGAALWKVYDGVSKYEDFRAGLKLLCEDVARTGTVVVSWFRGRKASGEAAPASGRPAASAVEPSVAPDQATERAVEAYVATDPEYRALVYDEEVVVEQIEGERERVTRITRHTVVHLRNEMQPAVPPSRTGRAAKPDVAPKEG